MPAPSQHPFQILGHMSSHALSNTPSGVASYANTQA
jgi:hypothetical protein